MNVVVAVAAWLLTAVAAFGGHGIVALLALVVSLLATAAYLVRPRHPLAPGDHVAVDGWHRLDRELRRQRRHGRHISLGRIQLDVVASDLDAVAHQLGAVLRGADFVFVGDDLIYLVLPEEDASTAEVPVDRLSGVLHDLGASGTVAVASYPSDGLTVSALLDRIGSSPARRVGVLPAAADLRPHVAPEATDRVPGQRAASPELRPFAPTQPESGSAS